MRHAAWPVTCAAALPCSADGFQSDACWCSIGGRRARSSLSKRQRRGCLSLAAHGLLSAPGGFHRAATSFGECLPARPFRTTRDSADVVISRPPKSLSARAEHLPLCANAQSRTVWRDRASARVCMQNAARWNGSLRSLLERPVPPASFLAPPFERSSK